MVHSKNRNSRPSAVDPVIRSDVPYGSGVCVHVLACWVHFLCMCGYAREHVCVCAWARCVCVCAHAFMLGAFLMCGYERECVCACARVHVGCISCVCVGMRVSMSVCACVHTLCVCVCACWVHFLCMCGYASKHECVCVCVHAVCLRVHACWVHSLCMCGYVREHKCVCMCCFSVKLFAHFDGPALGCGWCFSVLHCLHIFVVLGSKCVLHCSVLHSASWLALFFSLHFFSWSGLWVGVCIVYLQSFTVYTLSQSRLGMEGGGGCISWVTSVFAARLHGLGLGYGHLVS